MSLDNLPALFLSAVAAVCLTQHSHDNIFVLAEKACGNTTTIYNIGT